MSDLPNIEDNKSYLQTVEKSNQELTLNELRKLIPKEMLNPPSVKNFVGFLIKFFLFALSFYFACAANSVLATSLWTLANGVFLFSLGTVGHDCGHGGYIRPRWLNELIGQICMTLHGMAYNGWKHSHNTHHANTNKGEHDPDRLYLFEDEYYAMPPVARFFWRLFHTKCFWLSAVGHYFRSMLPWPFIIESKTDREEDIKACKRDILILAAVWIVLHTGMLLAGFGFKSIFVHFAALIVGFACLSVYVRTEHFLLKVNYEVDDKPWLTSRTIVQHPLLDFLSTNLNYHVEHHVLQTVPHANLPLIRPAIKKAILKANQGYPEDDLWNFLKIAFNQPFHVLERNTFEEIPAS
ncbi:MAG: fatty acid desaturase [Candidatus Caenarcaniphilales bacterium]|nr:fatty acid desaturase [Candidatus Caenarcaniphilales bacterium]